MTALKSSPNKFIRETGEAIAKRAGEYIAKTIGHSLPVLCILCSKIDGFDYLGFAKWYYQNTTKASISEQVDEATLFKDLEEKVVAQLNIAISRYKGSAYTESFIAGVFEASGLKDLYQAVALARAGSLDWTQS